MSKRAAGNRYIIAAGHICLDVIPTFPEKSIDESNLLRPGSLNIVGPSVISTGGSVSNTGLALHRLGFPVKLIGRVGKDYFGDILLKRISQYGNGLADYISSVDNEVTSYSLVINPPGVDRIFYHCPGANDSFNENDISDTALKNASVFHFGYPPVLKKIYRDGGRGLLSILKRAKSFGAITSLDMALPDPSSEAGKLNWTAYMEMVSPYLDFFMPSIEELLFMFDRDKYDKLSSLSGKDPIIRNVTRKTVNNLTDKILEMGCFGVFVKLGNRGAYLKTGKLNNNIKESISVEWENVELYTPVFKIKKVKGTTGAGDTTIAGFLGSLDSGLGPKEAVDMAVAVGSSCVEESDAISGIKSWEQTRNRIKKGWEKEKITENFQ
ncbi:MAG: carbohydrate kinase family protein [Spirochaetes bacterium]|nr:MAG: carbohydrate kinase family protein [Spirochaetota bacterium]